MKRVGVGIIGGGLMGKETASAFARWFMLKEGTVRPELVAVADTSQAALDWFDRVPTVRMRAKDYREVLENKEVEVVYVAVPHDQHERIYTDVLAAGKDLLAEKPFGIDLNAAMKICMSARVSGRFVRCSSEFPFHPGAQKAIQHVASGTCGQLFEFNAGFWHSSDLDPEKPINWKRQTFHCGKIGVMGDLGMHVAHVPLRLGLKPKRLFSQLQNLISTRPDANGDRAVCDTWDNALLHVDALREGEPVAMTLSTKRIAPGEMNSWWFEAMGLDGAVRFSTKNPKSYQLLQRSKEQNWQQIEAGHATAFPVETGPIFEFGFPDAMLQMWAAFFAERDGYLGSRFGCARPEEALESHRLFQAALESDEKHAAVEL